jgi:hypothetical protein
MRVVRLVAPSRTTRMYRGDIGIYCVSVPVSDLRPGCGMARERIYKGVCELRDSLSRYVKMAGEGAVVIIRSRNKEILAILTSKDLLELCDSGTPLPHEFYAAFMRREEISVELMKILVSVSFETAQKILAAATELAKPDAAKRKAKRESRPVRPIDEIPTIAAAKIDRFDRLPLGIPTRPLPPLSEMIRLKEEEKTRGSVVNGVVTAKREG